MEIVELPLMFAVHPLFPNQKIELDVEEERYQIMFSKLTQFNGSFGLMAKGETGRLRISLRRTSSHPPADAAAFCAAGTVAVVRGLRFTSPAERWLSQVVVVGTRRFVLLESWANDDEVNANEHTRSLAHTRAHTHTKHNHTHTRARTHTSTHTHTRARARAHAHIHHGPRSGEPHGGGPPECRSDP